jgi:hypothetical protein
MVHTYGTKALPTEVVTIGGQQYAKDPFSRSFIILSLGLFADDRSQSCTLAMLTVCVTLGLLASTSNWLPAPGAQSCSRTAAPRPAGGVNGRSPNGSAIAFTLKHPRAGMSCKGILTTCLSTKRQCGSIPLRRAYVIPRPRREILLRLLSCKGILTTCLSTKRQCGSIPLRRAYVIPRPHREILLRLPWRAAVFLERLQGLGQPDHFQITTVSLPDGHPLPPR